MTVRMSVSLDGKTKITTGPVKVRKESVEKFLAHNRDAVLIKLDGTHDTSMEYKPGHLCRIEEENDKYNVFVGNHFIGQLPEEAISYADQIDLSPDVLSAMVGKVEDDVIFIYIA